LLRHRERLAHRLSSVQLQQIRIETIANAFRLDFGTFDRNYEMQHRTGVAFQPPNAAADPSPGYDRRNHALRRANRYDCTLEEGTDSAVASDSACELHCDLDAGRHRTQRVVIRRHAESRGLRRHSVRSAEADGALRAIQATVCELDVIVVELAAEAR